MFILDFNFTVKHFGMQKRALNHFFFQAIFVHSVSDVVALVISTWFSMKS